MPWRPTLAGEPQPQSFVPCATRLLGLKEHFSTTELRKAVKVAQREHMLEWANRTARLELDMSQTVVPMIHVADVRGTVNWYKSIGFQVLRTNEVDGEMDWAKLTFGNSEVMFSAAGRPSTEHRRKVDLYITADDVDGLFRRLEKQAEVVEGLHDTFYGMREFIIRDCNRFWITFGQSAKS